MTTASTTQIKDRAIVEIERLNFGYAEASSYDLDSLSPDRRVQVREVKHYAPKDTVGQFAIQMGETVFPPIVVTADGWIIDGNTRVGARLLRKEKFTPAIVVDVDYSKASDKQQDLLHALAATLNAMGGVRLTSKETRDVAERLIRQGWKAEQIGRAIGLKPSGVTAVKQELDACAKLDKVGLVVNGTPGASLRALGASTVVGLNDLPFKELAELSIEAGFNASEIKTAAKTVKDSGSDQAGIEALRSLRKENGDRIAEHKLTGHGKPPMSRQLRQRLGFVTKFAGQEQELIETDPAVNAIHVEALKAAIAVLTETLRLQES